MSIAENIRHVISAQDELVCWTRMQSEAGEFLAQIVARKEVERKTGNGVFFWGVGNPPAVATSTFARLKRPVQAIFSIMKSRPKPLDETPQSVLVWRRYFDFDGVERELPSHVLVTSRGDSNGGQKKRHYALMCYSREPLELKYGVSFDPDAYRNTGANGGPVGASQVTALLRKIKLAGQGSYEMNLQAQLTGSYWVKLSDPRRLSQRELNRARAACPEKEWLSRVTGLRGRSSRDINEQHNLL